MSLSYEQFQEMTSGAAVVDFWAEWCGPCKMFSPVFDEASKKYPGINFIKINIDENMELCQSLGIMSVPTVHFYMESMLEAEFRGAISTAKFAEFIDNNSENIDMV